jgi:hypothetical protein
MQLSNPLHLYDAISVGNFESTKFFIENSSIDPTLYNYLCTAAIYSGNIDILNFLIIKGFSINYNYDDELMVQALSKVVKSNNQAMISYLHNILSHTDIIMHIAEIAWENGNVFITKIIIHMTNDFKFTEVEDLLSVIKKGHSDLIQMWFGYNRNILHMKENEYYKIVQKCKKDAILFHQSQCLKVLNEIETVFINHIQHKHKI